MTIDIVQYIAIVVGMAVSVATAYYAGRKNRREEHAEDRSDVNELIKIKDEMIDALKEDRENLKAELTEQINANRELQKKVRALETRLTESERENTQALQRVLEAIAASEQCLNAGTCPNRRSAKTLLDE